MPKLSERDKGYLRKINYSEEDIAYVENSDYKYFTNYNRKVTEDCAIRRLGRKEWTYGIARARFHASSVRTCKKGSGIIYIARA